MRDDREVFFIAAGLAGCLVAVGLYQWMGFFGVGLLGLLIVFVAISADMRDAGTSAHLMIDDKRFTRGERAERKDELRRHRRATDYALMVGLAFLVIGSLGFVVFQLPGR